jgi:hypothetical protein
MIIYLQQINESIPKQNRYDNSIDRIIIMSLRLYQKIRHDHKLNTGWGTSRVCVDLIKQIAITPSQKQIINNQNKLKNNNQ